MEDARSTRGGKGALMAEECAWRSQCRRWGKYMRKQKETEARWNLLEKEGKRRGGTLTRDVGCDVAAHAADLYLDCAWLILLVL